MLSKPAIHKYKHRHLYLNSIENPQDDQKVLPVIYKYDYFNKEITRAIYQVGKQSECRLTPVASDFEKVEDQLNSIYKKSVEEFDKESNFIQNAQ